MPQENDSSSNNININTPGVGWSNGSLPVQTNRLLQRYGGSERRWINAYDANPDGDASSLGWSRIGGGDHVTELDARHSVSFKGNNSVVKRIDPELLSLHIRSLMAQLCEFFYRQGWATGTGGGVTIRTYDSTRQAWRVFVAPSGIQKEDMVAADMFELDMQRHVVVPPSTAGLRQSACTPLWYVVYKLRPTVECVIHTHSMHAVAATLVLDPTETARSIRITHLEMLKGVGHHAYDDVLEIPIIDNRPTEDLLADQLAAAVHEYPASNAVLVRRHGIYVWGDSWQQAKTQAESFDYVLQCAVQLKMAGVDVSAPPKTGTYRVDDTNEKVGDEKHIATGSTSKRGNEPLLTMTQTTKKPKTTSMVSASDMEEADKGFRAWKAAPNIPDLQANLIPLLPRDYQVLLLDIEGCTTSIAFVHDQLFPYVRQHVSQYLEQHDIKQGSDSYDVLRAGLASEVDDFIKQSEHLRQQPQVEVDRRNVVDMVHFLMDHDVKCATLKDLQGRMWKDAYERGHVQGHVYPDFLPMLEWMHASPHSSQEAQRRVAVYIYSSGSIQAQKLLFEYSCQGNLLPFIAGHYDIPTAGPKKEPASYRAIATSIGVDPEQIVFVSDAEAELQAARDAGIGKTIMSVRPGNASVSDTVKHNPMQYPMIYSLLQLCGT